MTAVPHMAAAVRRCRARVPDANGAPPPCGRLRARTRRLPLRSRWWLALLALAVVPAQAVVFDSQASSVGFTLKTRWGQTLDGRFPTLTGSIDASDDGLKRVRLTLDTRDVEIVGHPRYTRLTRGEGFFDAGRHPHVEFVSDPHDGQLAREGGKLGGFLTIRGVRRREVMDVAPASCDRPGLDCDVVVRGVVYRSDFAMDRWAVALSDRVELVLRLRAREQRR